MASCNSRAELHLDRQIGFRLASYGDRSDGQDVINYVSIAYPA